MSEPLMKCRKRTDVVRTRVQLLLWDKSGGDLFTAQTAAGMKAARAWLWLLCGTWEPVAPMRRKSAKWRPHEAESTDAGHGGGSARSSDEAW